MNHKKAFEAVAKLWKDEYSSNAMPDLLYNGPTKEPNEFGLRTQFLSRRLRTPPGGRQVRGQRASGPTVDEGNPL